MRRLLRRLLQRALGEPTAEPPFTAVDLARLLPPLVHSREYYTTYFRRWEAAGVHVTPVHFYSPIPDTRTLSPELWSRESELPGLDLNEAAQLRLLGEVFPTFRAEYETFSARPDQRPGRFRFDNGAFDGTDALALYCMIRHARPRRILEVGSGWSTRIAAEACLANGGAELTCVEPYPDEGLAAGLPGVTELIPKRVQEVGLAPFLRLGRDDVLFIDSSHVASIGSDVTFLYLEVLPRLAPGVLVHAHDIYFPGEYPRAWLTDRLLFWNEQYVLQAFLAFNRAYEILYSNSFLGLKHPEALRRTFPTSPWWGGGSLWIRRRDA